MHDTIKKIHKFIAKLILILENNLEDMHLSDKKSTTSAQKNIADILNKLVNLMIQLNKLSKEQKLDIKNIVTESDQEIIERFLKYRSKK